MKTNVRSMTLTAILSALSVIVLYVSGFVPTGTFTFPVVASLFLIVAVIESGVKYGIAGFVVSSILGFLLTPEKGAIILYICFFGYYPIIKSLIERLRKLPLEWLLKLVVFNIAFWLVIWIYTTGFMGELAIADYPIYVLILGANVVFVVYDLALTSLAGLYLSRIYKKRRRK